MDLAYFLILDAIALMIATIVLIYFFFKDVFKQKKNQK